MLIKLAWRNIWRNKRRSIITIAAIIFAVMTAIAMRGVQLGTYDLNITSVAELFSGYLQIQEKKYQDQPSLNMSFIINKRITNALESTKGITGYAPRIYTYGLISYKLNSKGAEIFGIEPDKEKYVTTFIKNINSGKFFTNDSSNQVVLGEQLLENLGAKVGDEIVILAQGYDGVLGNQKFKIAGTIRFGVKELESELIFMGIKSAQSLLDMGNKVNGIAIKANNLSNIEKLKNIISNKIANKDLAVLTWNKLNPELEQEIQLDNISGILFLAILIIIVAFGILNTFLMSIIERYHEFGVELAIGMPQFILVSLIYIETLLITFIGLILGNIIGYIVNYYLSIHPVTFSGEAQKMYELYHFLPQINASLRPSIFINVSYTIFIVSLISCIYPIYKVYKLEPLKGIRHT